jgi:hypothetical protein
LELVAVTVTKEAVRLGVALTDPAEVADVCSLRVTALVIDRAVKN